MINRAAVILKCKEPAVRWINEAEPYDKDFVVTLEQVNEDRTVYLVSDEEAETGNVDRWIKANWRALFESELSGWYTLPELWPKNLTFKLFKSWFDVECHTVIEDTVGEPIYDDDI